MEDYGNMHLKRCQHQLMIWSKADVAKPVVSLPEQSGWKLTDDDTLIPILMTTEAVPAVCIELLTCGCKTKRCNTSRCTCNKHKMKCSLGCSCMNDCMNPNQTQLAEVDSIFMRYALNWCQMHIITCVDYHILNISSFDSDILCFV